MHHSNEFMGHVLRAVEKAPVNVPVAVYSSKEVDSMLTDTLNLCRRRGLNVTGTESIEGGQGALGGIYRHTEFIRLTDNLTPTAGAV